MKKEAQTIRKQIEFHRCHQQCSSHQTRLLQGPYGKSILFSITMLQMFWRCFLTIFQRDWGALVFYLVIFVFQILSAMGKFSFTISVNFPFFFTKKFFLYNNVLDHLIFWINWKTSHFKRNIKSMTWKTNTLHSSRSLIA